MKVPSSCKRKEKLYNHSSEILYNHKRVPYLYKEDGEHTFRFEMETPALFRLSIFFCILFINKSEFYTCISNMTIKCASVHHLYALLPPLLACCTCTIQNMPCIRIEYGWSMILLYLRLRDVSSCVFKILLLVSFHLFFHFSRKFTSFGLCLSSIWCSRRKRIDFLNRLPCICFCIFVPF